MIVDLSKRWMERGTMACLGKDPELFFTDHGAENLARPSRKIQIEWDKAKAVCATCPVMKECARDNLGELDGVWGGLDPAQRVHLRHQHALKVRKLTGPRKEEYARLAWYLRMERSLMPGEVGRLMGLGVNAVAYLVDWWKAYQEGQRPAPQIVDLDLPEEATVTEINVNAEFPERPPSQGDGWVRYGRRVTWGYYLGETEDGAWIYLKIRILGDYSPCWIKAEDFHPTRDITRNVMIRSGKSGSRIYGTPQAVGGRTASQAG